MTPESWATSAATRRSMLGNKRTDTAPERTLRSALHSAGLRFRKDYRVDLGAVRTRPDIVFTRPKVAVFVDGCFWHSCPEHGTQPNANSMFWAQKLTRNAERDRQQTAALREAGWIVVRIWEHETIADAVQVVDQVVGAQRAARSA